MDVNGRISTGGYIGGGVNKASSVIGDVSRAQNIYVRELRFGSRYEFPNIGDGDCLYAATDEHKLYYFDTINKIYLCVGSDYNEIEAISVKLKE